MRKRENTQKCYWENIDVIFSIVFLKLKHGFEKKNKKMGEGNSFVKIETENPQFYDFLLHLTQREGGIHSTFASFKRENVTDPIP